jgi:transcriptional regulator with XRE-family HTH domain
MNIKRADFGKWLQEKREASGLSQNDVERKLPSVKRSLVAQWEGGFAAVPIERLFDLAELYNVPMKDIIEKLQENEPGIMDRFNGLALRFAKYHLGIMTNNRPGEIRRHHGGASDNIYYCKSTENSPSDLLKLNTLIKRFAPDPAPDLVYTAPMIPLPFIRDYCRQRITEDPDRATLLDIYFVILKSEGRSYAAIRAHWIDENSRQLDLFIHNN